MNVVMNIKISAKPKRWRPRAIKFPSTETGPLDASARSFGTASTTTTTTSKRPPLATANSGGSSSSLSVASMCSAISNPRMNRRDRVRSLPSISASGSSSSEDSEEIIADDVSCQRFFADQDDEEEKASASPTASLNDNSQNGGDIYKHILLNDDTLDATSAATSAAPTRRKVTFDETIAIGSIPTLAEYSTTELQALYYSDVEEDKLRSEAKYVVKAIRLARMQNANGRTTAATGRILEGKGDGEYCPRGLENYLLAKGEKRARKAEARDHAGAVFLAQEEHAETDLDATRTAVAAASAAHSRRARATAIELALQDEEEVRQMAPVGEWERRDRLLLLEKERQEEQQKEGRKPLIIKGRPPLGGSASPWYGGGRRVQSPHSTANVITI